MSTFELISTAVMVAGVLSTLVGGYVKIVNTNTKVIKDLDSCFNAIRELEEEVKNNKELINNRISKKYEEVEKIRQDLYDTLQKAEAERVYVKKEALNPVLENLTKNQEALFKDLKAFQVEVHDSIKEIANELKIHIDKDREFQNKLFNKIDIIAKNT